jgi:lipid-A-disaccharide synthase
MPARRPRIFLVAGEVSGDLHGADLAAQLLRLDPTARLEGIGGRRMAAAGVRLVEDSSDWGVIGWVEAARYVRPLLRRLAETTARLLDDPPDVLVPIDFPGFNLALLKRLRRRVRAVYYVPPMVAVRRGRRAERVAALGARLLAIFPFEAEAYRQAGGDVVFVGHPAVDHLSAVEPADEIRRRLDLPVGAPVLGLLPGSRRQELDRLLEPMLAAAAHIRGADRGVHVLLALASPSFRAMVEAVAARSRVPVTIVEGARDLMHTSAVLLMAAGTATVEAMVLGVPMVVAYRLSRLTWAMARRIAAVRFAAIPNIMAGDAVVPELLQERANAEAMSQAALELLRDRALRERTSARLRDLARALGPPGAAQRAALEVLAAAGRPALMADSAVQ